jgi:PAS domain S-box-containing protein
VAFLVALPVLEGVNIGLVPSADGRRFLSGLFQLLGAVAAAGLAIRAARELSAKASQSATGWACMAIATCCWALGWVLFGFIERALKCRAYPGVPDVFFLLAGVVMILGLWRLPRERVTRAEQWSNALDIAALGVVATVVVWHFNARFLVRALAAQPSPAKVALLGYPVMDTTLLLVIFWKLVRGLGRGRQFVALLLLVIGSFFRVTADLLQGHAAIYADFTNGSSVDLGWVLFSSFTGLAACHVLGGGDEAEARHYSEPQMERFRTSWTLTITYLWIGSGLVVLIWALFHRQDIHPGFLVAGVVAATLMAVTRQVRTLRENTRLYQELQESSSQLEAKVRERTAELRKSEERTRLFFERQQVGMAITSPDRCWLQVNDRLCAILGYSRQELTRLRWSDLTHPEDLASDLDQFDRLLAGDMDDYSIEKRYVRKDGRVVYADLSVACVRHSDGSVDYVLVLLEDITERKQAQEALRESEERFRRFVKASPMALVVACGDHLEYANEAFCRLLGGAKMEDLRGESLLALVAPESREQVAGYMEARRHNQPAPSKYLAVGLRSDGAHFPCEISAAQIDFPDGPLTVACVNDITERVESEEALQSAHRRLLDTIESLPDATFVIDQDKRVIAWNRACEQLTGVEKAAMLGQGDYAYGVPFHGQRRSSLVDLLDMPSRETESSYKYVKRVGDRVYAESFAPLLNHGQGAHLWAVATPLFDRGGKRFGAIEVVRDVTELKQAEKAARDSEAVLASLFASTPAGVGLLVNRRFQKVNNAMCRITGYTEQDLLQSSTRILYGDQDEFDRVGYELYEREGRDVSRMLETRLRRKDGNVIHALVGISPFDPANWGAGVAATFLDITERKRAEDAVRASLDEKTALLKEVHHRVKNNLQIVSSLLSLQAARVRNRLALEVLRDTQSRVRSMALIHETLYRSENLARVNFPVYIENLCAHLFRAFGVEAGRIQLARRVASVALELDEAVPCGLIVVELVSNALKHAFPEGRTGLITLELQADPGALRTLRVADNGVGLPAGLDPLHTDTLGLKLVSNLADQLGGTLEIERTGGTAFRLTFRANAAQNRA